jgi:hypothetical protein
VKIENELNEEKALQAIIDEDVKKNLKVER